MANPYSGRHNHALTATNAPQLSPQQQQNHIERRAQARVDQLTAIAAHFPGCDFKADAQRPGVKTTVKGLNLACFGSWDAQTMRLELFQLTPEQCEKLARFIAHDL